MNILYPEGAHTQANEKIPDFVAYNQPTTDSLSHSGLAKAIRAEVATLFGDYGAGAVERSLMVKYLSHATSTVILRCSRAHYRLVWAALTFMNRVPVKNGKPCTFRVVRVSGTIRKVEEEAIRRARQMILIAKEHMAGKDSNALGALFGNPRDQMREVTMVDVHDSDSEGNEDMEND